MYGKSKIQCEIMIRKINPKVTKYCILRFFNVCSSLVKNKIGEFHSPETHLLPIVINSIFLKKKYIYMVIIIQQKMVLVIEIIYIF